MAARTIVRVPAMPLKQHPPPPWISVPNSIEKLNEFLINGKGKTVLITG